MPTRTFERYALFYTPAPGAFADFGAAWLGWDSAKGQAAPQPELDGLDMVRLTARPRKYGFHATLKAPFHLADGCTLAALDAALEAFAVDHAPVSLGTLEVRADNGFLAIRPMHHSADLRCLAGSVVRDLDVFRAPLSQTDIVRRRTSRLSPRQNRQLEQFGYPYIFEDFHFHMTLSGRLRKLPVEDLVARAAELVEPVLPAIPMLDAITLMGQDADGMFHQIRRRALSG